MTGLSGDAERKFNDGIKRYNSNDVNFVCTVDHERRICPSPKLHLTRRVEYSCDNIPGYPCNIRGHNILSAR